MLVVMKHDATKEQIERVVQHIENLGYHARPIRGVQRTAVAIVGNESRIDAGRLSSLEGVAEIMHVTQPYRLASREWKSENTNVALPGGLTIGGDAIAVIAGPCSVESQGQILEIAHAIREAGASILRGGAFKPRTSPYSFQGIGIDGLRFLARAREESGLPVVTEAVDPQSVEAVEEHADIIQIGARNMQNYSLLRRVGQASKPVLLKRGVAATIDELLLSAEYVLAEGNEAVILCERGVRGFGTTTRNILDLTAIPLIQQLSHLPVIADPSHGTGSRALVAPMACAAVAAGAHGIMVEVHPRPEHALSDGAQSLYPNQFVTLMTQTRGIAEVIGRSVATPTRAPVNA